MGERTGSMRWLLVLGALSVLVLLSVLSIRYKSYTYDEPRHLRYGQRLLEGNSDRFTDGTMPVSALNAVPSALSGVIRNPETTELLARPIAARLPTIAFSVLAGICVFRWAREMYGFRAGLFSLTLFCLSPNLIAHSRLITTDFYAAGMALIALYYFWRLVNRGGWSNALLSAFSLGLCQLTKYVCLFLYPAFLLILILRYAAHRQAERGRASGSPPKTRPAGAGGGALRGSAGGVMGARRIAAYAVVFIAVSVLVINAGFLFNRSMTPLMGYQWRSSGFEQMAERLRVLGRIPIPLPYPFLEGLDWGNKRMSTGERLCNMYLMGEIREVGGFKGYYCAAFLFKVPLAVQAFIVLAAASCISNRRRYRFFENELFIVVPVILYMVYFNFFFSMQLGLRHVLIILPMLHVFCGSLLANAQSRGPRFKAALGALLVYLAVSVLSYFPHYISYFNEIVWDRKQAYKYLADSNIDWGQNAYYLNEYAARHPEAYIVPEPSPWRPRESERREPEFPGSGLIVIGVNRLVGLKDPEEFRWLRETYEPVDHVAYSHLVFDIPPGGGPARDDGRALEAGDRRAGN